jgi:hypothetical protein
MNNKRLLLLSLCLAGCIGTAYAAVDVLFGGRGIRFTKTATSTCAGSSYNCLWFDTSNNERFYDATRSRYTVNANTATPTSGKWVLATDSVDGGLKWIHPTDGGLVLP